MGESIFWGNQKKMPALSFDDDFKAMGLTTIS